MTYKFHLKVIIYELISKELYVNQFLFTHKTCFALFNILGKKMYTHVYVAFIALNTCHYVMCISMFVNLTNLNVYESDLYH